MIPGNLVAFPARVTACVALGVVLLGVAAPSLRAEEPKKAPTSARVDVLQTEEKGKSAGTAAGNLLPFIGTGNREVSLKSVLDYLSGLSGLNIRAANEKVEQIQVSFELRKVSYRGVLDFLAKKYGLMVDDSALANRIILVSLPEKVTMVFDNEDIVKVINAIAVQANANIVVNPEVTGRISMRLDNVPWNEALHIVVKTLDYVIVNEPNDTLRITTRAKMEFQKETRLFRLSYLTPESAKYTAILSSEVASRVGEGQGGAATKTLLDVLSSMLSAQGKLAFVKGSSAIIVTDTTQVLDAMETVIAKLDTAPKQIHVSVKIVDLTDIDAERFGVSWGKNGMGFQYTMPGLANATTGQIATAFPFDISKNFASQVFGHTAFGRLGRTVDTSKGSLQSVPLGFYGFTNATATFEMLRTKTNSRLVQSPQLVTLDNEEATLQVGRLIRYAESFIANTEGGGNVSGFREATNSPVREGLQLLIIPHVTGPENNVLMTAIPKTEDFLNFEEFVGPNGTVLKLPQTQQRIVVNKMLLRNNETGVIGGLRSETTARTQDTLPIFGDIPILGRLFKHRTLDTTGRNLMVFITPSIVDIETREDFTRELDKLRSDDSKPWAPIGVEEETPAPPKE